MNKREYRKCVRVIIVKGSEVLLCRNIIAGKFVGYVFPGGGIEGQDSANKTVIKECLEEVGALVSNIRALDMTQQYDCDFDDAAKLKSYKGNSDAWYQCTFVSDDARLYNSEGDAMKSGWVSISKALELLSCNVQDKRYGTRSVQALIKFKELRENSLKNSITQGW